MIGSKKILGQEPAFIVGLAEAFLVLLLSFGIHGLDQERVNVIVAVVTAVLGVVTAYATKTTLYSALIGLTKSALILGVTFGLPLTDNQQASMIAFATLAVGLFLRQTSASTDTMISSASPGAFLGPKTQAVVEVQPVQGEAGAIDLLMALAVTVMSLWGGISLVAGWEAGVVVLALLVLAASRGWFWHRHRIGESYPVSNTGARSAAPLL